MKELLEELKELLSNHGATITLDGEEGFLTLQINKGLETVDVDTGYRALTIDVGNLERNLNIL